jgi:hypothetical protein
LVSERKRASILSEIEIILRHKEKKQRHFENKTTKKGGP